MRKEKVVAIIPARGGSKGLPRKNIRKLCGKPLIGYAVEAAKSSPLVDRVIVTTDDAEIAETARAFGAEVPFLRPSEIDGRFTLGSEKVMINVGSVGQPRDHNPNASFALFDTEARKVSVRRVPYDVAAAAASIREAGLPEILGERLKVGR